MTYKGFEIIGAVHRQADGRERVYADIYRGDKRISVAANVEMAKRTIDAHTASGMWKPAEETNTAFEAFEQITLDMLL